MINGYQFRFIQNGMLALIRAGYKKQEAILKRENLMLRQEALDLRIDSHIENIVDLQEKLSPAIDAANALLSRSNMNVQAKGFYRKYVGKDFNRRMEAANMNIIELQDQRAGIKSKIEKIDRRFKL